MKDRLKIFAFVPLVIAIVLLTRLFWWQIIKGRSLSEKARNQYQSHKLLRASRGNILASDGNSLAINKDVWNIYASKPDLSKHPQDLAPILAKIFSDDPSDGGKVNQEEDRLEKLLSAKNTTWVALKKRIDQEKKQELENFSLKGINFEEDHERSYPEASMSAQLLGFVGKNDEGDDTGFYGLEGYYDTVLSGKQGFLQREKDARGVPTLLGASQESPAVGGVNLLTHIDKSIQIVTEKKLTEGIARYGAKSGLAAIMNPKTGGIVAMSSFPSYDPLKYWEFSEDFFRNPIISDSFEPGSIFKPLVMAAALDSGVVTPDARCDICAGPVKVDKYEIATWDKKYRADATMTDIIVHSDNVGMTFVAQKLGADRLYDYLEAYGLGKKTGIDLQGEVDSFLRKKATWNIVDLATAGFGQGIAVTPIQMLQGISVIANKGLKVGPPQVVDKIVKDGWEEDIKPEMGKRVISQKAANEITEMMVKAVKNGEAKWTAAKGFKIAGKTGTAQIPVSGHYDENKTIASFIGFAPADDPKFVMLVSLTEPTTSPWGSETAAPLWFSIARDIFPYLGIQPED